MATARRDRINRWRHSGSVYQQMQGQRKEQIVYYPTEKEKSAPTLTGGEILVAKSNTNK